jgi:hypothetical protein
MADSERWHRFAFRDDDVVITTPSKSGTTWMQTIVGMLLLDRVDVGVPISQLSPWLDMQIYTDEEVFGRLERQTHRRVIKTHTPLDGIPAHPSVTFIALIRHPLDVALSDRDHTANMRTDHAISLRVAASGQLDPDVILPEEGPVDPADYLRWFLENDNQPVGSGPYGLADYCQQILTYWDARTRPNVHLFHNADLWASLDAEMRRCRPWGRDRRGSMARVRRRRTVGLHAIAGGGHRPERRQRHLALTCGILPGRRHPGLGIPPGPGRPHPVR